MAIINNLILVNDNFQRLAERQSRMPKMANSIKCINLSFNINFGKSNGTTENAEAKKINPHLYASRLQQLHDVLFSMAFLIAFAVSYLSPYIITLLYGEQFSAAAKVLAINIWAGVFVFHGILRGQYLIIENKQNIGLWFRGLGALINIGLNFILIPEYGAIGAAWATLISYGSPVFIVALFHPLVRTNTAMCLKSYIFPIRALLYKRALYQ